MPDRSFLSWPFFEDRHRALAERLEAWCAKNLPVDHHDVDAACRGLVALLGKVFTGVPAEERAALNRAGMRATLDRIKAGVERG